MASPVEVMELVIRPLHAVCRPLCDPERDKAGYARGVDQYCEALSDFTPNELIAGMQLWRTEWASGVWPVPGMLRRFICQAQREASTGNPRLAAPEHRLYRPGAIPKEDRERIGGQLTRWRRLMASGAFWEMGHAQAYDAVYADSMPTEHRERLR